MEIVIHEAYFLQAAALQISQGLRDGLVVCEFIHRDMHFRLRRLLGFHAEVALHCRAIYGRLVPQ